MIMNEEDFLELISKIPRDENDRTLSTYGSINVDDLQSAVKRLKKIPDYEQLLKENKDLQQRIDKAIEYIENERSESAERQGFYNCFPDDLYISNIEELLSILQGKEME